VFEVIKRHLASTLLFEVTMKRKAAEAFRTTLDLFKLKRSPKAEERTRVIIRNDLSNVCSYNCAMRDR
jgi:hypothetical protein